MLHELFLTMRQKTKLRNAFANNMLIDIKLSKVQISKIVLSSGSFAFWFGNLGKKSLKDVAISFTGVNLPELVRSCETRKRIYFIYFE